MEADEALALLGGVASRRQLDRRSSRGEVDAALAAGRITRVAHGRFALPGAARAAIAAERLHGTLAGLSAAEAAGWELLHPPDRPWIAVPSKRSRVDGRRVHLVYSDQRETDPVRIVLQCARRLPWPEALAVADSALRSGQVEPDELHRAAHALRGPGAPAARRVAAHASAQKTNPLESALHALALEVPGLRPVPQLPVDLAGLVIHPDLADAEHRIAIEAEGWLFHGATPRAFDRDVQRYSLMTAHAWRVLRFTRHHVLHEPAWVTQIITLTLSTGETGRIGRDRRAADRCSC